jgi:hypothetical protein
MFNALEVALLHAPEAPLITWIWEYSSWLRSARNTPLWYIAMEPYKYVHGDDLSVEIVQSYPS